jgi:hypothetical protein
MSYLRFGKFLFAIVFTCGLLCVAAPVKAQRPIPPTREAEGQQDARRQSRLAPPPGLKCDANHVTSFTGRVVAYSRRRGRIFIRIRTDEATTEEFNINYGRAENLSKWFLINGQSAGQGELTKIESRWRRDRKNVRATVWACYDNAWQNLTPNAIDWQVGRPKPPLTL